VIRVVAAAALAIALLVVLLTSGTAAPATRADALVPADAVLYVHVSTDPDRELDRRLVERLRAFPALSDVAGAYDRARPWLGDEAAFVVTPVGSATLLAVRDGRKAAEGALVGGFSVIGDPVVVAQVRALAGHHGKALADLPDYAELERADDRAADLWAAPAATRLLPSALAFLGGRPISAEVVPTEAGLRVTGRRHGGAVPAADFEARLLGAVPRDAFAYVGLRGLDVPGLPASAQVLADALDGELAVSIAPSTGEPAVTLVARVSDPAQARAALAGLQGVVAATLTGSGEATGQVPVFEERSVDGHDAYALTLAGGGELIYAVVGDRVVVSSREEGLTRALRDGEGLDDAGGFRAAVTDVPDRVQALAFVAANQLLELADESGLDAAETYRAVRPNLARIRALGAVVRRQGNDTTAELNLLIP
jgi:hypothetical protein